MTATTPIITVATVVKFEAPDGDVLLCDGGMLNFNGEAYVSHDPVFGTIAALDNFEAGFGDMSESADLVLAPNPDATLTDWFREDLENCRVRVWQAREFSTDLYTVTTSKLVGDFIVDTINRDQGMGGQDLLRLSLIGWQEKLYLKQEGNVCSEQFHRRQVWNNASDEKGFNNCTDLQGFIAWGAPAPSRGSGTSWPGQ